MTLIVKENGNCVTLNENGECCDYLDLKGEIVTCKLYYMPIINMESLDICNINHKCTYRGEV